MLNKLSRYYNCGWTHNLVINYSLRLGLSAIEYGLRLLTFKMLIYPHSVARELRSCRNTRYLTILLIFNRHTYSLITKRLFIYFNFYKWILVQSTLVTKVSTKMCSILSGRKFTSYVIILHSRSIEILRPTPMSNHLHYRFQY
jgi:hypothetical protein